jgi:vacuolar-type H+-ATPase subunit B/Vma2
MKLVSVFSAAGLLEADMLKAFLEAQGLQVILSQESVGRTLGLSAGHLGKVEVLVPEEQAESAKQLIDEIEQGKFDDFDYSEDYEDTAP